MCQTSSKTRTFNKKRVPYPVDVIDINNHTYEHLIIIFGIILNRYKYKCTDIQEAIMNEYIKQISDRIRELRDILDLTAEEVSSNIGVSVEEYLAYENGEKEIPISLLYKVAGVFKVDPTVLMTGDVPRMDDYTVVRGGNGVKVERYPGYSFSALAFNYKHRQMDPMIVTLSKSETAELVRHGGQEFNYVIEGAIKVVVGDREFTLEAGDSIYFNPEKPHGQRAVTETAKFLTIINE